MSANAIRGETTLTLDGVEYVLRPSYEARQEFQEATGKGIVRLAQDASASALTDGEMAQIATSCIRAWGRETNDRSNQHVNVDVIGGLMAESEGGMLVIMAQLKLLLFVAVTGGYTAKGELKAPAAKTGAPTPPRKTRTKASAD